MKTLEQAIVQLKDTEREFEMFKQNTAFREGLNIKRRNELEVKLVWANEVIDRFKGRFLDEQLTIGDYIQDAITRYNSLP